VLFHPEVAPEEEVRVRKEYHGRVGATDDVFIRDSKNNGTEIIHGTQGSREPEFVE
jgi:hypothetical protein